MSERIRIAIDLAKSVFQLAIADRPGKVTRRPRLNRKQLLPFLAQQPEAVVFMEACGSAHFWGRTIQRLGHHVVLLPPHHVRPYVRGNKTDRTDAQGILDAGGNEDLTPVPIKTVDQQQLASIHRLRSGWMAERTRRLNAIRGLLRELGIVIALGAERVVPATWAAIEDADADVPDALRPLLAAPLGGSRNSVDDGRGSSSRKTTSTTRPGVNEQNAAERNVWGPRGHFRPPEQRGEPELNLQ